MTKNELQEIVESWENLPVVIASMLEKPELLGILFEIAIDDTRPKNWRAMYLIDQIHDIRPEIVVPFFPEMRKFLFQTSNQSKKRHILRMFSVHEAPDEELGSLLELCIHDLTNAAAPIAVRANAMQILYNIAVKEPDFAGELIEIIAHEIEYHGSAGISTRGTKIIAKLRQLIKNSL
jgi:hypothetical protein